MNTHPRKIAVHCVLALSVANLLIVSPLIAAPRDQEFPSFRTIGVIPPQWMGGVPVFQGLEKAVKRVNGDFSKLVRSTERFQVINDEVVSEFWSSPTGRATLARQYEIDAFFSLTITNQSNRREAAEGDVVTFLARFMSPDLKQSYIIESDSFTRGWLRTATEEAIEEKLENLIFRVINRLPVDISVTSVQGRYITLSGGSERNLHPGDKLSIYRTKVTSIHPANGSWLDFSQTELGKVQVIETKKFAAVAQLTDLAYEDAIKIGDGARIPAISSRVKFQRLAEAPAFRDLGSGAIVVSPLYGEGEEKDDNVEEVREIPVDIASSAPVPTTKTITVAEDVSENLLLKVEDPIEVTTNADLEKVASSTSDSFIAFDDFILIPGLRIWSSSGRAAAKSAFPDIVVNHIEGIGVRKLSEKVSMELAGMFDYGPTINGSFVGLGLGGKVVYNNRLNNRLNEMNTLRIGADFGCESLGVSSEKFGGTDVLKAGIMGGGGGRLSNFLEFSTPAYWLADISYLPFVMGKAGIRGSKRNISSGSIVKLATRLNITEPPDSDEWEVGGAFNLSIENYNSTFGSVRVTNMLFGLVFQRKL